MDSYYDANSVDYYSDAMEPSNFWIYLPILVVLGTAALIYFWLKKIKIRERFQRSVETRCFLITLPKETQIDREEAVRTDFRQIISVAEQMFGSFSGLGSSKKKLTDDDHITFEIIADQKLISFYIFTPKKIADLVEKQIHSYYPTAEITPMPAPNIFKGKASFSAGNLKLMKNFAFPIKTYLKLESDTLNNITNAMSKMGEDSSAAFQLMIRPMVNQDWRRKSEGISRSIQEGKINADYKGWKKIFKLFSFITKEYTKTKEEDKYRPLTPIKEDLIKDIGEKANKVGFAVMARIVTTGPAKNETEMNLKSIASAFHQFYAPDINGFKLKGGKTGEIAKSYIFKDFHGAPEMVLNTEELASLFHFPNKNVETPGIRWLVSRILPPPANLPEEGVVIGKSVYRGQTRQVRIKDDDRRRHLFMIGKTGTGKTTLFINAILQDISAGKGVAYLDPNGDAVEEILSKIPKERAEDVIYFDPSDTGRPMGLNLLEWKTQEHKDFLVQDAIEMFYKLFDPNHTGMVGPQFEHWFRNAALTLMSDPQGGTLIEIPRLFTDDAYREKKIQYVDDPVVKAFWTQQLAKTADFHKSEMYNYFISKFGRFMTNTMMRNIIGQPQSSFDFREVMDQGKILLVNLSKGKLGDINANLLGMILVSKLQVAAFSRADMPEEQRKDFYLYVDEFQNFTTDTFATILSEARKYRLDLAITNQYIDQLTEQIRNAVIGNVGTIVTYRIGASDAAFLKNEFPALDEEDFMNLDFATTYVKLLVDGTPTKPFSMKGIKNDVPVNQEIGEAIRQLSRLKHGRDIAQVEREIEDRTKPIVSETGPLPNLPPREAL